MQCSRRTQDHGDHGILAEVRAKMMDGWCPREQEFEPSSYLSEAVPIFLRGVCSSCGVACFRLIRPHCEPTAIPTQNRFSYFTGEVFEKSLYFILSS